MLPPWGLMDYLPSREEMRGEVRPLRIHSLTWKLETLKLGWESLSTTLCLALQGKIGKSLLPLDKHFMKTAIAIHSSNFRYLSHLLLARKTLSLVHKT